jgi:hypothetical protein
MHLHNRIAQVRKSAHQQHRAVLVICDTKQLLTGHI